MSERRPDAESVSNLKQKYSETSDRLRNLLFDPQDASLADFQIHIGLEILKSKKTLTSANNAFLKALDADYRETRDGGKDGKDGGQSGDNGGGAKKFNGRERFKSVRLNAFVELNDGMQWATDRLYHEVKRIIRNLDDGDKNLNAFSAAIKKKLEAENILEVEYKNGVKMPLDKYANMLARSSRSETINIASMTRGNALGTDLVKCTTIFPTCALCASLQGRVYSVSGNDKRFPALFETAFKHGYTLIHPNCRHEFMPYFEELQPAEDFKKDIERSNRPFKDSREAKEREAYAKWQEHNRRRNDEMKEYVDLKAKLGDKMPYTNIGAFRRAARVNSPTYQYLRYEKRDTAQYAEYMTVLDKNMPFTLDEFRKMKYNDNNRFYRLKGYKEAFERKPPHIPDTFSFEKYEEVGKQIGKELVGLKTKDGLEVKGFVNHFIDRVIGQTPAGTPVKKKREGVAIDDVKDCILNGNAEPVKTDPKTGNRSVVYVGEKCKIAINPDTGNLIQTNPRKRK